MSQVLKTELVGGGEFYVKLSEIVAIKEDGPKTTKVFLAGGQSNPTILIGIEKLVQILADACDWEIVVPEAGD